MIGGTFNSKAHVMIRSFAIALASFATTALLIVSQGGVAIG